MDKLYSWSIMRSGASMTITHSCGKLTGIVDVHMQNERVVALRSDGRQFLLHVAEAE